MKILIAASEIAPFAEGTLGADVAALAGSLSELGHEVDCVVPLSRRARETSGAKRTRIKFDIPLGQATHASEIWEDRAPGGGRVFFVRRDEFFDRSGLYGNESGDYQDNAARFVFFAKATVELARRMDPSPDVVHAHGWHAGLVPVFLRASNASPRTVLTPHGLSFQGNFWSSDFGLTNLPGNYFSARGVEFYGSMNFLKGGILFSDGIVLPGERFAAAAKTSSHGCGLENVLREQTNKIWGIPSAADLDGWDPATDPSLPAPFSASAPSGRSRNRRSLANTIGWNEADSSGVVFTEAAETSALLEHGLERMLQRGLRLIVLGPSSPPVRRACELAARTHAKNFCYKETFTEGDARQALAGTDLFIIPGPASPTSPWLLRALRYGCAPLALQCEGLTQTARQFHSGGGNAFLFWKPSVEALSDATRAAMDCLAQGKCEALAAANMQLDFSPAAAAAEHLALYSSITGLPLAHAA